jgi:hypothetical protein
VAFDARGLHTRAEGHAEVGMEVLSPGEAGRFFEQRVGTPAAS